MTLFSEKVLISNRCISGLMSNLIKKSGTVSIVEAGELSSAEGEKQAIMTKNELILLYNEEAWPTNRGWRLCEAVHWRVG